MAFASINIGQNRPLEIPNRILDLIKSEVSNGLDTRAALNKVSLDLQRQVKEAGGFGTAGGDQAIRRLGFEETSTGPNMFETFIASAQNDVSGGNDLISSFINNVAPTSKVYAPGSLQKDNAVSSPVTVTANPTSPTSSSGSSATRTSTPSTSVSSITPPSVNLQPGATGTEVKKLQDYLVSTGYMTQAQVNTGYGTYGPQTTAAIKKLQADLGVDNSSGPGYWGPRTIAAISQKSSQVASSGSANADPNFQNMMSEFGLAPDQQNMVEEIYNAVLNNDTAQAERLKSAFNAATQYSDPYFRAQTLIVTDALSRALDASEGDLSYQEGKLQNTLDDILKSTASSKDYLTFNHAQELSKLARSYEKDLEDTRQSMASKGFTSSSVRSKSEQLLRDENEGLVESSNRTYGYQTGNLTDREQGSQRDFSRDLSYLRDKAVQDRISKLREAETKVGSKELSSLGYGDLLGGVGGDIERAKVVDALSFSNSAGFLF